MTKIEWFIEKWVTSDSEEFKADLKSLIESERIDWSPRNDANCEAVQGITQGEREKWVADKFREFYVLHDIDYRIMWDEFIKSESYLSIPPATDTTTIKTVEDAVCGILPVTDCCGIGPITYENYCPNCGKQILKP